MAQEYPKSELPIGEEKRPEEKERGTQIANFIEAWEEAHKVKEEYIGEKLRQDLTDAVNNLKLLKELDPLGETEEFKFRLQKVAQLGEEVKKAEQRFEAVKEGKKFAPLVNKAIAILEVGKWLDFWNELGFSSREHTREDFQDLGRFIEMKFGPPFAKLGDKLGEEFAYYSAGGDLIFEIVTSKVLGDISRIQLIRDRAGHVRELLKREKQPSLEETPRAL